MGVLIKDPEAERAVRELAELTGESLTPEARAGLIPPITKADFDALNAIPGVDDE